MKNTVFPHKFWRPFLDCMPQLFFRPQYVWFPVHLKGSSDPTLLRNSSGQLQNWLFTLFHQSRSVLSPNPIGSALVQIMACRMNQWWPNALTHICGTRGRRVKVNKALDCTALPGFNSSPPSATYMRQWIGSALVQIMACRLFGAKPLSKPILGFC